MNQKLIEIMNEPLPFTFKVRKELYNTMMTDNMWGAKACEISKGIYYCWKYERCPFEGTDELIGDLIVLYKDKIYKLNSYQGGE